MDLQLSVLFGLTFVINLVGSLAYFDAHRRRAHPADCGVAVQHPAAGLSHGQLFPGPMLAKRVESSLAMTAGGAATDFRWLLAAASLATIVGGLLTPTFQRLFTRAVQRFAVDRSVGRLVVRLFSPAGLAVVVDSVAAPSLKAVVGTASGSRLPAGVVLVNVFATAVWTVGVFASLYAAHLNPNLRVTSSNLSGIINGVATILLFVVVDPHLSLVTDDVLQGRASEPYFRRCVVWMLGSRLLGTFLAQLLLVPAAMIIATLAEKL
jgi:hypothetical protein